MPVEKSEESVTLRFSNLGGDTYELVLTQAKFLELRVAESHVERNKRHYAPLGVRTELVNGRPHKVLALREIEVLSLDRSDLDE